MKNFFKYFLVLTLLPFFSAQAQEKTEDIVLKAMQDELNRNMSELKLPGYDKPFFIMYGIQEQKTYTLAATLGSITQSNEKSFRFKNNTRVLVGDYAFNDESLEDNLTSAPTAMEIGLPLDNDYHGIRRSLWSTTDKVYRDAARHFQKHQQTLKETGKQLEDIPHRSFAKGEPVRILSTLTAYSFDKKEWEEKLKRLSSLFIEHPFIINSAIALQFTEGHQYMVNSEGVVTKVPFRITSFVAVGQLKGPEGELVADQLIHTTFSPETLPSEEDLKKEMEAMITGLEKQLSIPKFEEGYSGPVLLVGPVVAHVFSNILSKGTESIVASNFIPRLTGYQFNNTSAMDNKIGKSLVHESVTIKAKPKLKSYNGIHLLSAYEIDDEGIVPPDEVTVIEKGVLKNLLNDRTLTNEKQTANGFSSGFGVLEISISQKNTEKELKQKLIEKAKADGLDYALIIRHTSLMGIMNVYKVAVADGKEELLRNAFFEDMSFKTLKRVLGASAKYQAYDVQQAEGLGNNTGGPAFFIVPEALLLGEVEVKSFDMPILKEDEYVINPLLKKD